MCGLGVCSGESLMNGMKEPHIAQCNGRVHVTRRHTGPPTQLLDGGSPDKEYRTLYSENHVQSNAIFL